MSSDAKQGWERPFGERLAIVEQENITLRGAVVEIKDAVVAIRATLDHVARLDERNVALAESARELRQSLEAERENRMRGDRALESRIVALEKDVPINTWRLSTAGVWVTRIGVGIALILAGAGMDRIVG